MKVQAAPQVFIMTTMANFYEMQRWAEYYPELAKIMAVIPEPEFDFESVEEF